jgi:hypothetical protein
MVRRSCGKLSYARHASRRIPITAFTLLITRQSIPQRPECLIAVIAQHPRHNLPGFALERYPSPDGVILTLHKRVQLVQLEGKHGCAGCVRLRWVCTARGFALTELPFFDPLRHGLTAHAEQSLDTAQGDAFLERFEDLGFERVAVLDFEGVLDEMLAAGAAEQALFEIGLHAVFDGVLTLTVRAVQHGSAYINLRAPLPPHPVYLERRWF